MHVSGDVVVGEVKAVPLVLLTAIVSLGFAMGFLFPRVMLSRLFASSAMVVLRRRGRCDMRVSNFTIERCGFVFVC